MRISCFYDCDSDCWFYKEAVKKIHDIFSAVYYYVPKVKKNATLQKKKTEVDLIQNGGNIFLTHKKLSVVQKSM